CFDAATDIATWLNAHGQGDACVAPYLDTRALAEKLQAWLSVGRAGRASRLGLLSEAAGSAFQPATYAATLKALGRRAHTETRQAREDAALILDSGALVPQFVDADYDGTVPAADIVRRYLRGWQTGLGARKPQPGFHPGIYRAAA